jgi:hypothetical protein
MADLVVVPANVLKVAGSPSIEKTAGATITQGQALYDDGANGVKLAQANAVATSKLIGVSLNAGSSGQPIEVLTGGDYNPGVAVVVGVTYVVSAAAAGGIAPIADLVSTNVSAILGTATTTSNIKLGILNSEVAKT